MMNTNFHYVGAFLNPYIFGNNWIHKNVDAKEGIKCLLQKRSIDATSYVQILIDFANFVKG